RGRAPARPVGGPRPPGIPPLPPGAPAPPAGGRGAAADSPPPAPPRRDPDMARSKHRRDVARHAGPRSHRRAALTELRCRQLWTREFRDGRRWRPHHPTSVGPSKVGGKSRTTETSDGFTRISSPSVHGGPPCLRLR